MSAECEETSEKVAQESIEVAPDVVIEPLWDETMTAVPNGSEPCRSAEELRAVSQQRFGVDLLRVAGELLDFLRLVAVGHQELYSVRVILLAVDRCMLWLHLLEQQRPAHKELVPPVDVAMVWHSLLLRRSDFVLLCEHYGVAPSAADLPWRSPFAASAAERDASQKHWDALMEQLDATDSQSDATLRQRFAAVQRYVPSAALRAYAWQPDAVRPLVQSSGACRQSSLFGLVARHCFARIDDFQFVQQQAVVATLAVYSDPSCADRHRLASHLVLPLLTRRTGERTLSFAACSSALRLRSTHTVAVNFESADSCDEWLASIDVIRQCAAPEVHRLAAHVQQDQQWLDGLRTWPLYQAKPEQALRAAFEQYLRWLEAVSSLQHVQQRFMHGPPFHIDIFWHSHLMQPARYASHTASIYGNTYWHVPMSDLYRGRYGCCVCL